MKRVIALVALATLGVGVTTALATRSAATTFPTPITHVVVFFQENHSFDNLLGALCLTRPIPCDGATTGKIGTRIVKLSQATDVVPVVDHTVRAQNTAIDGGKMDGFYKLSGCGATNGYACYTQFQPSQIPNVAKLADTFTVSDHTFEMNPVPSWGAHLELVSSTLDHFNGDRASGGGALSDWGCDSGLTRPWFNTTTKQWTNEPMCVPAPAGSPEVALEPAAVQASPVAWVPTVMDRMNAAGLTWKIYAAAKGAGDYRFATCPYFGDCLYTSQLQNMVETSQIVTDATNGTLPNFSVLLPHDGPTGSTSQHNSDSMTVGDNWIGQVVSAIENGPDWSSTAILLSWDDCGCFYDHVAPPKGRGIRIPMIIISPYAKPGYTDPTPASIPSILAFTEHAFNLAPLSWADALAYNFSSAFNYSQPPLAPAAMRYAPEPAASKAYIATHPADSNDPT